LIDYNRAKYLSYKSGYIIRIGFYEYDGTFIRTQQFTMNNDGIVLLPDNPNCIISKYPYWVRISVTTSSYVIPDKNYVINNFRLYTLLDNNYELFKPIPDYFKNNVNSALNQIKANMDEVGRNGETFIFITDIHWENNAHNSPSLIHFLNTELKLNNIFNGGDLINGSSNATDGKTWAKNALINAKKNFSFLGNSFKSIFGNHDTNHANNDSAPGLWLSDEEYYNIIQKSFDMNAIYNNGDETYYYTDVKGTKTRYLCLDTRVNRVISNDQLEWITSILNKNDDYKVIVLAHMIYTSYNDLSINESIQSLFNLLDQYSNKVMCIIGGHVHKDYNSATNGGIPIIITDCDGLATHSEDATLGTINEQCFDVITVNYNTGTVKCVRIGRGSSRTISRT